MKTQSTQIRYGLAMLALCCMQNNTGYSMQSSSYAARLYTVLQDRRTWGATAAALLFLGTAWYAWQQYKKPGDTSSLTENRGITHQQVADILHKHHAIVQLIDTSLAKQKKKSLSHRVTDIHVILNQGNDHVRGKLVKWLKQFEPMILQRKQSIVPLITDLMSLAKSTQPLPAQQPPQQPPSSSPASLSAAPTEPTTKLTAFPDIPKPSSAAPGQPPQYTTTRGISEDEVEKILVWSNKAVELIDEFLLDHNITTLSDQVKDVHKILNHGDQTHIDALAKWLEQFKPFFQESQTDTIDTLIKDLVSIATRSKST